MLRNRIGATGKNIIFYFSISYLDISTYILYREQELRVSSDGMTVRLQCVS